jgi:hypothetical protein
VRLEVVDVAAGQPRPGQGRRDKALLRTTIRDGQTAGRTVLVDGGAGDHRGDPVAVALGVAESLEHQDAAALTADVAVGGRVEGLALPDRRQHPRAGRGDHCHRAQQHVDPTGDREITVTGVQCLYGLVDGHQR